jgi:hypothetical protein
MVTPRAKVVGKVQIQAEILSVNIINLLAIYGNIADSIESVGDEVPETIGEVEWNMAVVGIGAPASMVISIVTKCILSIPGMRKGHTVRRQIFQIGEIRKINL